MTNSDPSLLQITQLSKRFTGTLALDRVDFDVRRGEVHALLGENGAGKSTLIKVLAGVNRAEQGEILFNGRIVDPMTEKLPITFIHQDLGLVDTMTVAENIAILAGYPRRHGIISWRAAREAAVTALDRMGGGISPDARVRDLPAAERSIVAIARAMAVKCELLVLDADGGASRSGRGTPAGGAAAPARRRLGHRLCDASAGRGFPHLRSRHRAARRPPHRH